MKPIDLLNLITERRTVHTYNNKVIHDDIIKEATHCFLHAPNHHSTQPWKLYNVTPKQRSKLSELFIQLKSENTELADIKKIAIQKKVTTPSHLIVLLQLQSDNERQAKEDYAAIACAVMSMKLYFWSHQIGSKWSSGQSTKHDETYKILDIDRATYEIVGFLWAGYYDAKPRTPKKLKPDDVWL